MKKIFCLILVIFCLWSVKPVLAVGPLLKFTPSSGTYHVGDTFKVVLGADSGTEKTQAIDAWATYDTAKLELVSIVKSSTLSDLGLSAGEANIDSAGGKFDMPFYIQAGAAAFEGGVVSGDLATLTFKAKATGTAAVNFTCSSGSSIDSNIFNTASNDVINCASNVNGLYTIIAGDSDNTNPTATPVPATTTINDDELPKTGNVGTTVGLMIFGIVGILSSLALRFL